MNSALLVKDPEEEKIHQTKMQLIDRLSWYFVILFVCFGAGGQMIAQIYDKRKLKSFGQMNYFVLYLSFFLSSLIVNSLIKRFNKDNHSLKTSMSLSVLFYTVYQIGSAYTCWCTTPRGILHENEPISLTCSYGFLLFVNIFCSFMIGFFGATMLWGVQFLYINKLAKFT